MDANEIKVRRLLRDAIERSSGRKMLRENFEEMLAEVKENGTKMSAAHCEEWIESVFDEN
jgi:hypothetical protein